MIKVLIVEDSPVTRLLLKHILGSDPDIRIVGVAENGVEAVTFIQKQKPDVITMDIHMPKMNGLVATRTIMETTPIPIVIVTASYQREDVEKSFLAMEAGAVAIVEKPFGEGHLNYHETAKELVQTVKLMSEVKMVRRLPRTRSSHAGNTTVPFVKTEQIPRHAKLIVMGASTGGPPVLQTILSGLKGGFPVPVLVVQHIAKGFLGGMVEWLGQTSALPVHTAFHGVQLQPGHVYFAPDDFHLGVENGGRVVLSKAEPENGIRPSVSYLFRSAIRAFGENIAGVLLTGMGKDGAEELLLMKERGAVTIAQDRESSVVYGMPGEAVKLGAATYVLPPDKIASALESITRKTVVS